MRSSPALGLLVSLICLAAACSGSARDPETASPPQAQPRAQDDGGAPVGSQSPASADERDPQPLTQADCDELIAHVVDVAVREDAAENPELPPPTDEAIASLRAALGAELEDRCVGRDRGVYDCAMQAQARDELAACDEPT